MVPLLCPSHSCLRSNSPSTKEKHSTTKSCSQLVLLGGKIFFLDFFLFAAGARTGAEASTRVRVGPPREALLSHIGCV